jgi:hypothetical protein
MPLQFIGPALTAAQSLSHTAALGGSAFTGQLGADYLLSPAAVFLGNYLRSDQGQLLKDRVRQGDIPGAFTALTGLGRSSAPRLEQFNPPDFDPNKPVTLDDLRQSIQEVGPLGNAPLSAPPVPQLSPEERAYNQERSRIAQLTSATPEERSKLRGDLRDEGMRIWAAKYGDLAKKVKPGQSGYEVIQEVLNK